MQNSSTHVLAGEDVTTSGIAVALAWGDMYGYEAISPSHNEHTIPSQNSHDLREAIAASMFAGV